MMEEKKLFKDLVKHNPAKRYWMHVPSAQDIVDSSGQDSVRFK